jgi:hypothetical protein
MGQAAEQRDDLLGRKALFVAFGDAEPLFVVLKASGSPQ